MVAIIFHVGTGARDRGARRCSSCPTRIRVRVRKVGALTLLSVTLFMHPLNFTTFSFFSYFLANSSIPPSLKQTPRISVHLTLI